MKFATHRPFLAGGGIALLAVLAYLPALRAGFVWDDIHIYILNNPLLRQADGVLRSWFTAATPDYYPLAYTTFWLEWRVWGDHPAGYHAVNIVLHAITCVLLWRVLRRLDVPGAWAAAAVFAVHPVTVETVAWISQRKALLAAAFGFGTLLYYFKHDATKRRLRRVTGAVLSVAIGKAVADHAADHPARLRLVQAQAYRARGRASDAAVLRGRLRDGRHRHVVSV